jgi:hypothetical protein
MVSEGKRSFHCRRKSLTAQISGWRTVASALNKHSVNVIFVLGKNKHIYAYRIQAVALVNWIFVICLKLIKCYYLKIATK